MIKRIHLIILLLFALTSTGCVNFSGYSPKHSFEIALSADIITQYDFQRTLRKIWVVDNSNQSHQYSISFRFDEIEGSTIKGSVSNRGREFPPVSKELHSYSFHQTRYAWHPGYDILLVISNNVAKGYFETTEGEIINLTLELAENGLIYATIECASRENKIIQGFHQPYGYFIYRPLNISDFMYSNLYAFTINKEMSFEVNLDVWGDVHVIAGTRHSNRDIPVVVLADNHGNVLYSFIAPFQSGVPIYKVIVADTNNDGLTDVIIITSDGPYYQFLWIFHQLENGWFHLVIGGDANL